MFSWDRASVERDRPRVWVYLAGLAAMSAVTRLPQLLSPNLFLDGDQSLIGLMAKHFAQGDSFAIFAYGQHYGLSAIEAAAAAIGFLLFGIGAVQLKAAMLALWTVGILFIFLALAKAVGIRRSFWITAVLLVTPAWADPSMAAWGGYVTAFTATAILIWLLYRHGGRESWARWAIAGALTAIIYLARPLWLPGAIPFIAVAFFRHGRRRARAIAYAGAAAGVLVAVALATVGTREVWEGPALGNPALLQTLPGVARQIYVNLTGSYFLSSSREPPGAATALLARVWYVLLVLAMAVQGYRVATRRFHPLSHLLFLSVAATVVSTWALLFARDARYLLPMSAPLVVLAGIELTDLMGRHGLIRRVAVGLTAAALVLGSISMYEFRAFNHLWKNSPDSLAEAERLRRVIYYLQAKDVRHVYSMNGMLQFQLMFYSQERVVGRWMTWRPRYPAYKRQVDRALTRGRPVAVVGYTDTSGAPGCWDVPICTGGLAGLVPDPESIVTIDDKYFIYIGADEALLRRVGFRFGD